MNFKREIRVKIMKKKALKIISAVMAVVLLAVAMPLSTFASNAEFGELNIAVLSDPHYFAQENIDDLDKCKEVCEKTMSTAHLSDAIIRTALRQFAAKAAAGELDYLLMPGDLTKNGDYVSHTVLAGILENFEKETGVEVIVINGNHDINNPRAEVFKNGKFEKTNRITTPEEFREIYKNLGYDLAVNEFTPPAGEKAGDLSYVAQLKNGYRIVALDGGIYTADVTADGLDVQETGGKYTEATFNWGLEQIKEAKEKNYSVLGLTHFGLVPHYGEAQLATLTAFLIEDCEYISECFADAGMQYVFTGHLHTLDVSQHISDNGNIMYDIATSGSTNFPNLVRTVKFDNTVEGEIKADIKTHSVDELEPVVWNGITYPQPISDETLDLNFTGNDAKDLVMDLVSYYVEDLYLPQIKEYGGLYEFLCKELDLENLIDGLFDDLLGGGIGFAGITILGTKNAMGLIKDLCAQIDAVYVSNPDKLMSMIEDLVDSLLELQISDVSCTKFIEKYGFGDASRGGNFNDLACSVLVYMYNPYESVEDDAFMLDVRAKLETGAVSTALLDLLIDELVNDFLLEDLLSDLELHISSAFPFGTLGFMLVRSVDLILEFFLCGNKSFTNIIDTVFSLLGGFGVLEYSSLNGLLEHYIGEYLTLSQMETIDGEIAFLYDGFCVDDAPEDCDLTLVANLNGGYEVEATADNLRLPSHIAVTFGDDSATTRNISWYTKKSVTGDDVQLSETPTGFGEGYPAGVKVEADTQTVKRTYPGVDIGIAGLLNYEFDVNRHTAKITGLKPGTTYYYRIGDASKGYWSKVGTITTADNSDSFTFFHVSDSQSGLERQYKVWANVLDTAFEMYPNAAFLMHTGDNVDHGNNFRQWKWALNTASDSLMNTAYMTLAGNHEGKGEYAISDNFLLPSHPEQDETVGVYYSFDYNNAHFIVLNTNDVDDDTGLSAEQLAWLKADAAASDADWKIVSLHKALYSNGSHYDDSDVEAMRAQLAALMPKLGIDVVLQGHDHVYLRTDAMNSNKVVEVYEMSVDNNGKAYTAKVNPDGTIYAIDGCSGVKYYQTKNAADTDKLFPRAEKIVDATYPVFAAIRIEGNKLFFDSYAVKDNSAENIDSFAIVKDASISTPKFNPYKISFDRLSPAA